MERKRNTDGEVKPTLVARSGRPSSRAWLAMSEYDIPGVSPSFWLIALAIVSSSSFFCWTYSVSVHMHLSSKLISKCGSGRQVTNFESHFQVKKSKNSKMFWRNLSIERNVKHTLLSLLFSNLKKLNTFETLLVHY